MNSLKLFGFVMVDKRNTEITNFGTGSYGAKYRPHCLFVCYHIAHCTNDTMSAPIRFGAREPNRANSSSITTGANGKWMFMFPMYFTAVF